jgi:cytochrome c-type biogenesis protein CcmH/NrfG
MLAMDAFQQKDYERAIALWERLLPLMPEQSRDSNAIRQAIAAAQQKLE